MNIKTAKQEISNSVKAYIARDEKGEYLIPTNRQRPILLIGPPGVGKTAIMEQVAAENKIGLVLLIMDFVMLFFNLDCVNSYSS